MTWHSPPLFSYITCSNKTNFIPVFLESVILPPPSQSLAIVSYKPISPLFPAPPPFPCSLLPSNPLGDLSLKVTPSQTPVTPSQTPSLTTEWSAVWGERPHAERNQATPGPPAIPAQARVEVRPIWTPSASGAPGCGQACEWAQEASNNSASSASQLYWVVKKWPLP